MNHKTSLKLDSGYLHLQNDKLLLSIDKEGQILKPNSYNSLWLTLQMLMLLISLYWTFESYLKNSKAELLSWALLSALSILGFVEMLRKANTSVIDRKRIESCNVTKGWFGLGEPKINIRYSTKLGISKKLEIPLKYSASKGQYMYGDASKIISMLEK